MLPDQLRSEPARAIEVECPEFPDEDGAPGKLVFRVPPHSRG